MAATPASSKRRASSSTVSSEVSAQPATATLPSRASRPTATRAGNFRAACLTSSGSRTAAGPAFDRRQIADAAAELHRDRDRFDDPLDRRGVDRLAGKGAVEVDDVE